jgi:hypothetical protein
MKKKLAAAAFTLTFVPVAMAQVGQSSGDFSRLHRPTPPPGAQMSPEEMKQRVEADKKAGRIPDRRTLQMLLSAQSQLKDEAGMADTLEELAADYNDPADWTEIINITFGTPGLRDRTQSGWAACCSWWSPRFRPRTPARSARSPARRVSSAMP